MINTLSGYLTVAEENLITHPPPSPLIVWDNACGKNVMSINHYVPVQVETIESKNILSFKYQLTNKIIIFNIITVVAQIINLTLNIIKYYFNFKLYQFVYALFVVIVIISFPVTFLARRFNDKTLIGS